jgi:hypothetical protein
VIVERRTEQQLVYPGCFGVLVVVLLKQRIVENTEDSRHPVVIDLLRGRGRYVVIGGV